jgi:hypothetical protein
VLVASVRQAALALAVADIPDVPEVCRAEVEDLLFARDRVSAAIAARVARVHGCGEAKRAGHASTATWLRSAGGMSSPRAGQLVRQAVQLARLPLVAERFATGGLSEGEVAAICASLEGLADEQAALAEPILVRLAEQAGPEEVARAGRHLRAVLDADGCEEDAHADYAGRYMQIRDSATGGVEGEFRLPREAAARLRALLDAYAKPKAQGDDRPLRVRNADAFIALLEQQISTELLVLVNAESLPADHPDPDADTDTDPDADAGTDTDAGTDADADTGDARMRDTGFSGMNLDGADGTGSGMDGPDLGGMDGTESGTGGPTWAAQT